MMHSHYITWCLLTVCYSNRSQRTHPQSVPWIHWKQSKISWAMWKVGLHTLYIICSSRNLIQVVLRKLLLLCMVLVLLLKELYSVLMLVTDWTVINYHMLWTIGTLYGIEILKVSRGTKIFYVFEKLGIDKRRGFRWTWSGVARCYIYAAN